MNDLKSAVILTIKSPGLMTEQGRRDIAAWLRRQANMLSKDGEQYTDKRFTARYLYEEGNTQYGDAA